MVQTALPAYYTNESSIEVLAFIRDIQMIFPITLSAANGNLIEMGITNTIVNG